MTTKVYQNLICPRFTTFIEIDGKRVDLSFTSGGKEKPKRVNGKFRTSNPQLIKALDESPYYGKKWVCISTDEISLEAVRQRQVEEKENAVKKIHAPKTAKEMREYLNKNLGVPWSKLPNKEAAFKVAKDMNLEFVNVNVN
jgi:hypothetical protein